MIRVSIAARLERNSRTADNGCRLWLGHVDRDGYGVIDIDGSPRRAHRMAFLEHVGPICDGLHVCHRCDTPRCIEPTHLFLGTNAENTADRHRKGRSARGARLNHPPRAGERNAAAKLTAESVIAIRARRKAGERLTDIGADFGVGASTVSLIARRRIWNHL